MRMPAQAGVRRRRPDIDEAAAVLDPQPGIETCCAMTLFAWRGNAVPGPPARKGNRPLADQQGEQGEQPGDAKEGQEQIPGGQAGRPGGR